MSKPTAFNQKWLDTRQKLESSDFIEWCAESGTDPKEVTQWSSFTQADKCSRPLEIMRTNLTSGEVEPVLLACMTNRADLCEECAEFKRRLRYAQIVTPLMEPGTDRRGLFITLTAPSWGKVHRSSFNAKDAYAAKDLAPEDFAEHKQEVMWSRDPCPCGDWHDSTEGLDGTPLEPSKYNYLGEIMFSENFPRLMKALVRSLKTTAKALGVPTGGAAGPSELQMFFTFERQSRGSLHCHGLLVLEGKSASLMPEFASYLESHFPNPSAEIPQEVLDDYMRPETLALFGKKAIEDAIPRGTWKGKLKHPSTRFGMSHDIQLLTDETDDKGESADFKRIAKYIAKYIVKGSASLAPALIKTLPPEQRRHHQKLRATAVGLLYERTSQLAASYLFMERDASRTNLPRGSEGPIYAPARPRLGTSPDLRQKLQKDPLTRHDIQSALFTPEQLQAVFYATQVGSPVPGSPKVEEQLLASGLDGEAPMRYAKSLKIRLNKLSDNGGFSGSIALTSNWPMSMSDLKRARIAKYLDENPDAETAYVWGDVRPASAETPPTEDDWEKSIPSFIPPADPFAPEDPADWDYYWDGDASPVTLAYYRDHLAAMLSRPNAPAGHWTLKPTWDDTVPHWLQVELPF